MSRKKSEQNIKLAARELRGLSTKKKNEALLALANRISTGEKEILRANATDVGRLPGDISSAFRDRLTLNAKRIESMVESLRFVASLPDPVNEVVSESRRPNGLLLKRVRAPLGVIFLIFESRPNVILEAFSLAFKSGNAIILRGGSESRSTAHIIYKMMRQCLLDCGLQYLPFWPIEDYDRSIVSDLLKRNDLIDVVVPRGGEKLIQFVQKTTLMPLIKNDRGLCHTFVDESADLNMAVQIVKNAKTQRPGVCNALETVLVHERVAAQYLSQLYAATREFQLEWRVDSRSRTLLKSLPNVKLAKAADWATEYLDLIMNCKIVQDLDEAISHIEKYGSHHSEAIVTQSELNARRFQNEVDAAAVYVNASTRFTDGFEFGLGGELGISTQKLHVRGPVGLNELTSLRWIIEGTGQIR